MDNDDELKNITLEDLLYLEYIKGNIPEETYSSHSKLKEWWDNLEEWEKQQIILEDYKFGHSNVRQLEPEVNINPIEHEEWEQS
jgi:hypothetical protein